jgi:hypothetical protein
MIDEGFVEDEAGLARRVDGQRGRESAFVLGATGLL